MKHRVYTHPLREWVENTRLDGEPEIDRATRRYYGARAADVCMVLLLICCAVLAFVLPAYCGGGY